MSERQSLVDAACHGFLVLAALGCLGCDSIRKSNERYYYERAKMAFRRSLPDRVLHECGDRLGLEEPYFSQMEDIEDDGPIGKYHQRTRLIEYDPSDLYIIVHEATHDILAYQSEKCLKETTAYYAERIVRLEDENERLKTRSKFNGNRTR